MSNNNPFLGSTNDLNFTIGASEYNSAFALDLFGIFKKFTTNQSRKGVFPVYQSGVVSGLIDSRLLNPFGKNTTFDGFLWGQTKPYDLSNPTGIEQYRNDVRSFGLKTPITYVGWGYDIFGYPAPNYNDGWNINGVYGSTNPTGRFPGLSTTGAIIPSPSGSDVPQYKWQAGPLDIRWDNHRKVWTSNYGLYSAVILNAFSDGVPITNFNTPVWPSTLTYDAYIYDGLSSGIMVTGVSSQIDQPRPDTYQVYPLGTGRSVIINQAPIRGRPGFGLMTWETPYAEQCASEAAANLMLTLAESGYLTYEDLLDTPLGVDYGGIGQNTIQSGYILMGVGSNLFGQKQIIAGTGITITNSLTGVLIQITNGINFNYGNGVNTTITALSGLTTPLSITQGGTGASGKIFVDLTSDQSIAGIKSFTSGIHIPSGTTNNPGLAFRNGTNYGWYYTFSNINVTASGFTVQTINPTGITFLKSIFIQPITSEWPGLVVKQRLAGSGYVGDTALFLSSSGTKRSSIDTSGYFQGNGIKILDITQTKSIEISATGSITSNYVLRVESTGSVIATRHHVPFMIWNESPTGLINNINKLFNLQYKPYPTNALMLFKNGILQATGIGNQFILTSGNRILFNNGVAPVSGDILLATYQYDKYNDFGQL